MSRTQPMSIEHQALGLVGADDELGRAAADVDDEVRRRVRSRPAVAPRNSSRGLLLAREQLGPHARAAARPGRRSRRGCVASRAALVAVARTRSTPSSSITLAVLAQHRERALDRVGMQRAVAVDALAEAGDLRAPLDGARASRRGRGRRRRRRAGGSSWCRCRPRRHASLQVLLAPSARRDRRRRRGGRRSARAGTSRRARVPPTPPLGRGPAWSAGERGVALGARSARARRRASSGSTAASAARTPPADSSRATRSDRSGSTSQ